MQPPHREPGDLVAAGHRPGVQVSRRTLLAGSLAGAAALAIGGCTGPSTPEPPPGPSPDDLALASARTDAADLLALTQATLTAQPALAAKLSPVAAAARAHLDALTPVVDGTPVPSPTPTPTPTPRSPTPGSPAATPSSPSPTPRVAASPAAALADVAAAARSGAGRRLGDLPVVTGRTARLLASLAAWGQVQAGLLTGQKPAADAVASGPAQAPAPAGPALARAWTGERAAAYGYGLVGPRLTGADATRARDAYDLHLALATRAQELLAAAGARPSQAPPAWAPTAPAATPAQARALAAGLETRTAEAWADVVAAVPAQGVTVGVGAVPTPPGSTTAPTRTPGPVPGTLRGQAAALVAAATGRSLAWGASLPAFPGLAERG